MGAASKLLLKRQLQLFGKIVRKALDHPLYNVSFITDSWTPLVGCHVRRKGRPHKEWIPEIYQSEGVVDRTAHFIPVRVGLALGRIYWFPPPPLSSAGWFRLIRAERHSDKVFPGGPGIPGCIMLYLLSTFCCFTLHWWLRDDSDAISILD